MGEAMTAEVARLKQELAAQHGEWTRQLRHANSETARWSELAKEEGRRREEIEQLLNEVYESLSRMHQHEAQLQTQVAALSETNQTLRRSLEHKAAHENDLNRQLQDATAMTQEQTAKCAALEHRLQQLQANYNEKAAALDAQRQACQQATQQWRTLDAAHGELQQECERLLLDHAALTERESRHSKLFDLQNSQQQRNEAEVTRLNQVQSQDMLNQTLLESRSHLSAHSFRPSSCVSLFSCLFSLFSLFPLFSSSFLYLFSQPCWHAFAAG